MACLRFWLFVALLALGSGLVRAEAPPPVAIGFFTPVVRDVPRKDVEISLRFWAEELARSIDVSYKPIRFYDDMAAMKRDVNAGTINFIVATSMGAVQHFSAEELRDGFSGYKNTPDHLLLVVRRATEIRRIADLAGKRVAVLDGDELTDVYLETLVMRTWGKPDFGRFATLSREKRSASLVHRLFFDQADAALIYRNAYEAASALNPQIAQRLQVLDAYSFKGRSPHIGLFSSRVASEHSETVRQAAMKLNATVRGRQMLDIYHGDAMVVTGVQDLEPFRELLAEHRALKAAAARKAPR